jgi:nicotinamide-nucleotide amidase
VAPTPRAVVVITGSELVRGARRDLNGPFLARELLELGLEPARIVVVGDLPEELDPALAEGIAADVCVCSGGLGPTHDDRTIELLARVLRRPLRVDPELEREIEEISRGVAERLGRPYHDFAAGVTKQASLPEGAVSLGLAGTAPGVLVEHGERVAIALPGPPTELRRLWANAVSHPALLRVAARAAHREHRVLRFFGPSESAVARALADAGGERDGLEATVCARDLEIHVDLYVPAAAAEHAQRLEEALRTEFDQQLFADDDRSVEDLVLDLCRVRGLTLATAESCTGGLVAARLTSVPGASAAFVGAIVAYADGVKQAELGVPADVLAGHGAVSAEAAAAMAEGARTRLGADVAVSVTGIAGPDGGSAEKPVGLVFVHAAAPDASIGRRLELPGDRDAIRARATAVALHALRRVLTRSDTQLRGS